MTNVVGVRFKESGKVYYFDPAGFDINMGDSVVVETVRGIECGEVTMAARKMQEEQIVKPLKPILRVATGEDLERLKENRRKEKEAYAVCSEKIQTHKLDMKLVDVEYTFDNNKILFYFTADGRVDFRELVKDLASVFRTRIELRQIGVRDEAKMLGGFGICGQPFCCSRFLGDFQPVSIKMAKEQGMSLNPVKISGICGRLMCCLKYEQDAYEHLLKITPKPGTGVKTPDGEGVVTENNLISGMVKVRMNSNPEAVPVAFNRKQLGYGLEEGETPEDTQPQSTESSPPVDPAAKETPAVSQPEQKPKPKRPRQRPAGQQRPAKDKNKTSHKPPQEKKAKGPDGKQKPDPNAKTKGQRNTAPKTKTPGKPGPPEHKKETPKTAAGTEAPQKRPRRRRRPQGNKQPDA